MTRQNESPIEKTPFADSDKGIPLPEMWRQDCDVSVLGDTLRGRHEDDDIEKQRKQYYNEGLVCTWQLHQVAGK